MRVVYVDSHHAANRRAVSTSGPSATGTATTMRVGCGTSARASPSSSSARPSASRERAHRNGAHSSASSPATRIDSSDSAASAIGTGTSGSTPSRSGRAPGAGRGERSPASSARTPISVSRTRATGRSQRTPCRPSVSGGLPAPSPSEKRPPEARCNPAAASAMLAGVRPHTESTPVPSPIRDVCAAISASTIVASWLHASATWTRSRSSASACRASRRIVSTRVSKGVNATPVAEIAIAGDGAASRPARQSGQHPELSPPLAEAVLGGDPLELGRGAGHDRARVLGDELDRPVPPRGAQQPLDVRLREPERTTRAGLPATIAYGGTSRVTTLAAATTAP